MDHSKWRDVYHTDEMFLAKLMEEVGEAAEAFRHKIEGKPHNLTEELEHVEFIARCWRRLLLSP